MRPIDEFEIGFLTQKIDAISEYQRLEMEFEGVAVQRHYWAGIPIGTRTPVEVSVCGKRFGCVVKGTSVRAVFLARNILPVQLVGLVNMSKKTASKKTAGERVRLGHLTPIVAIRSILNDIVGIASKKIEEGITQLIAQWVQGPPRWRRRRSRRAVFPLRWSIKSWRSQPWMQANSADGDGKAIVHAQPPSRRWYRL
jgi:hypothetical protein